MKRKQDGVKWALARNVMAIPLADQQERHFLAGFESSKREAGFDVLFGFYSDEGSLQSPSCSVLLAQRPPQPIAC